MDSIIRKNNRQDLQDQLDFFLGFPEESLKTASPPAIKTLYANFLSK